jgi:hypothetical protein
MQVALRLLVRLSTLLFWLGFALKTMRERWRQPP